MTMSDRQSMVPVLIHPDPAQRAVPRGATGTAGTGTERAAPAGALRHHRLEACIDTVPVAVKAPARAVEYPLPAHLPNRGLYAQVHHLLAVRAVGWQYRGLQHRCKQRTKQQRDAKAQGAKQRGH